MKKIRISECNNECISAGGNRQMGMRQRTQYMRTVGELLMSLAVQWIMFVMGLSKRKTQSSTYIYNTNESLFGMEY